MRKPISVLMLDGQAPYALLTARCLTRAPGIRLHVLSLTDRALVRYARGIAAFELMPALPDDAARCEMLEKVVRRNGIDVLLGSSEDAIEFISVNRDELVGMCAIVATPGGGEMAIARNKWLFSRHMATNAIPHPKTCLVTDGPAFRSGVASLAPPLLLKPVQGSGGEGMISFGSAEQLFAYVEGGHFFGDRYVVQSLVGGRDGGCNVLCRAGKILVSTVQKSVVANRQPFGPPSCVDVIRDEETVSVIARVMESLNWSGVANVDLRFDPQDTRVTVLEINPRYWGSVLASHFAGVNFPYLACLEGMGIPLPEPDFRSVRFTWHKSRVFAGLLAGEREQPVESRGSILRYMIPDPLPEIIDLGRKVFHR
jgi:D-aspartate ligase